MEEALLWPGSINRQENRACQRYRYGERYGDRFGVSFVLYCRSQYKTEKENDMKKLSALWTQYATPRNAKVLYILLSLVAVAVAGGAPGAGSGAGGIGGLGG